MSARHTISACALQVGVLQDAAILPKALLGVMSFTSHEGNRAVLGAKKFATTHWSVVLNAADGIAAGPQEANF